MLNVSVSFAILVYLLKKFCDECDHKDSYVCVNIDMCIEVFTDLDLVWHKATVVWYPIRIELTVIVMNCEMKKLLQPLQHAFYHTHTNTHTFVKCIRTYILE